jgi:hypothetical protein
MEPLPSQRPAVWPWGLVLFGILALGYFWKAPDPVPSRAITAGAVANQQASLRTIVSWGPKSTRVGAPFNPQPNGDSALWVEGRGDPTVVLELGGKVLETYVAEQAVTAVVPPSLLQTLTARAGWLDLDLVDPAAGVRQRVGRIRVEP